jgi:hypothetical protein
VSAVTLEPNGSLHLPKEARIRLERSESTEFRAVPAGSGILLVPLSGAPVSPELQRELDDWQALAAEG